MAGKALLKAFASEVRRSRTNLGLSQEELANRASLHRNYIGMIERAERAPTLLAIKGIARGLRLTLSELVSRAARGLEVNELEVIQRSPTPCARTSVNDMRRKSAKRQVQGEKLHACLSELIG